MKTITISLLILTTLCCNGQNYKPSIVVLSPYETVYDSALLEEIETFYFEGYSTPEDEKEFQEGLKHKPENIARMKFAEWNFRETKDFSSMLTMSLYGMISYRIFGLTDKVLIFPSRNRSNGQTAELRLISKRHGVRWVINPVRIHSYIRNGQKITTVGLQIFDSEKNRMVLNKEYTGDTKNPGVELTCEGGSLDCTINNVLRQSLDEMLAVILK
jgi:hypothetical protein